MSIGELAAMSWLAESRSQHEAVERFPDRVIAIDFDAFLARVPEHMARILGHFGLPADARYLDAVRQSPALTRYSKAPEYAYTPEVRTGILREARHDHRDEIRKGLAWLERIAQANPAVATVVGLRSSSGVA